MKRRLLLSLSISGLAACARKETVETYPQGQPKRVHEYSRFGAEDSLHLRKVTAYFLNGKPEFEAYYRRGRLDGDYRAYWQNGQAQAQGKYENGLREGEWEFHHNQFTLASKGKYRKGAKEGLWTEYWENGELKRRGEYRGDREVGEWVGWNSRGEEALRSTCFEANPPGHYRSFHEGGAVHEEYDCRNGRRTGVFAANYPDGTPRTRGFYDTNGVKDSLWESFHEDGRIASRETFRVGVWNDSVLRWDDSGRVLEKGFFNMGSGLLTRCDSTGWIVETRPMTANRDDGENWKYYPDGKRKQLLVFNQGVPMSFRRWHRNGALAAEGVFADGKRSGAWREWDEYKRLRESALYENGQLHGARRFFDSTGALTRLQKYYRGIPTEGSFPGIPGGVKPSPQLHFPPPHP